MTIIKLTAQEMYQAALCGCMRRISSIYNGRDQHSHGNIGRLNDWTTDIYGAAGEMAFAKMIGQYFSASVNTFKAPDVGNWQVRATSYSGGHLIIRDNDELDSRYVLVICDPPNFRIAGFITGKDGTNPKYRSRPSNGPECFMVPQSDLGKIHLGLAAPD